MLVCNPDVVVRPGALAALGGRDRGRPRARAGRARSIRTPDGDRYPSARQFPSLVDAAGHAAIGLFTPRNRFTRAYHQADLERRRDDRRTVDWVSGACFLVRRAAFEQVGGFDEAYFMYAEDVDLCWRLGRAGWRVAYVPAAEVTHLQGVSTDRHPYRMIVEHHRSVLRFATRTSSGGDGCCSPWWRSASGRVHRGLPRSSLVRKPQPRREGPRSQAVGCRPIMPSNSTGKWVQRAATTGGGRTYRGQMPVNWYATPGDHLHRGPAAHRLQPVPDGPTQTNSSSGPPTTQQTWYAALGIDICGTIEPNLPASTNTSKTGFTANGNGVLTIAPKNSSESGQQRHARQVRQRLQGPRADLLDPAVSGQAGA